jgi:hypothetical protein
MHACERCNLSTDFSGLASASGFAFAELRDKIWILLSRPSGLELVATPRATPIYIGIFPRGPRRAWRRATGEVR